MTSRAMRRDDQRPHRADRPPGIAPVQRDHAPPAIPEAGSNLARHQVLDGSQRNRDQAEDPRLQLPARRRCCSDLQRAPEFDQSAMFKKVYEEEFGVFGGEPFAACWATTSSASAPRTSSCWKDVAGGGGRPCSFLAAAASRDDEPGQLHRLDAPRDLAKIFDTTEYAKWKGFRQVGRFPLHGPDAAARPDARALRQGDQAGG